MNLVAAQPVCELHTFRHELNVPKSKAFQAMGNIAGDCFIAFPCASVIGSEDDGIGRVLVTGKNDRNLQLIPELIDLSFQLYGSISVG
jgi:hypothetical protein